MSNPENEQQTDLVGQCVHCDSLTHETSEHTTQTAADSNVMEGPTR